MSTKFPNITAHLTNTGLNPFDTAHLVATALRNGGATKANMDQYLTEVFGAERRDLVPISRNWVTIA